MVTFLYWPRLNKLLYFIFQVRQVLTLNQYKQISQEEIFAMIGGVFKLCWQYFDHLPTGATYAACAPKPDKTPITWRSSQALLLPRCILQNPDNTMVLLVLPTMAPLYLHITSWHLRRNAIAVLGKICIQWHLIDLPHLVNIACERPLICYLGNL